MALTYFLVGSQGLPSYEVATETKESSRRKVWRSAPSSPALRVKNAQTSLGCAPTYRARGLIILPVSYCSMA